MTSLTCSILRGSLMVTGMDICDRSLPMFLYRRFQSEGPPWVGRGAGRRVRRVQQEGGRAVPFELCRRVTCSADSTEGKIYCYISVCLCAVEAYWAHNLKK